MELVDGPMKERWGALSREDQFVLCEQLRGIVAALRRLEQDPEERFVGR